MSVHKDKVAQERANLLKTIRTAVRLRHSIAADEELNELLPLAEKKYDAAILSGKNPTAADIKRSVGL